MVSMKREWMPSLKISVAGFKSAFEKSKTFAQENQRYVYIAVITVLVWMYNQEHTGRLVAEAKYAQASADLIGNYNTTIKQAEASIESAQSTKILAKEHVKDKERADNPYYLPPGR